MKKQNMIEALEQEVDNLRQQVEFFTDDRLQIVEGRRNVALNFAQNNMSGDTPIEQIIQRAALVEAYLQNGAGGQAGKTLN